MLARLVSNSWPLSDPPALASQSGGITGMSHRTWSTILFFEKVVPYTLPQHCMTVVVSMQSHLVKHIFTSLAVEKLYLEGVLIYIYFDYFNGKMFP